MRVVFELLYPFGYAFVAGAFGEVEDHQSTGGTFVVRMRDGSVALLPCGVPNLGFNAVVL